MSLSEANLNKVTRVLNVTRLELDAQIVWLSARFTAQTQTDIEAELDRWDIASLKFTDVDPNDKNFGAKIRVEREKDDIRSNIAISLQRKDWCPSNGHQFIIYRG